MHIKTIIHLLTLHKGRALALIFYSET